MVTSVKERENEVVRTTGTDLAAYDFGDDAGAGTEDARTEEMLTPFLRMIQAGSPQLKRGNEKYLAGAQQGMLLNTATSEFYDGEVGLPFLVCAREYDYGIWTPFDDGGGFHGRMSADDPIVRQLLKQHGRFKPLPWVTPEGENVELVESAYLYVLYGDPDGITEANARRAMIRFSSVSLRAYQQWYTMHNGWRYKQPDGRMAAAALWAYRWRLKVVPAKRGEFDFFTFQIALDPAGAAPREAMIPRVVDGRVNALYAMGREFYDMVKAGQVKVDMEQSVDGGGRQREPGEEEDADRPPF